MVLSSTEFAESAGVCERVARRAFASGSWRGHQLTVAALSGQLGGASGMIWGHALDKACPELRALLKLPETLPSMPVERRLKGRPDDRHIASAVDKPRISAPIMAHPKRSPERAAAFAEAARQHHLISSGWSRFSVRTLRDWVQAAERGGPAALMPAGHRSDKGTFRVLITRRWQDGCGLPEDVQGTIARAMEGIARGLILKGRSDREVMRIAATELQRLSVEAGVTLPKASLAALCKLTRDWVLRFREMSSRGTMGLTIIDIPTSTNTGFIGPLHACPRK